MARRLAALVLALAILPLLPGLAAAQPCAHDRVDLRGPWGTASFSVEVADTDETRARGLMNRPSLPPFSGMLFVFPEPVRARFWMKNTLIPLDMLFAGPDGVVRRVHENARPMDETVIDGGDGVKLVLEINGGMAARLGIGPGTQLRHPSLGPGAAWPCGEDQGE